VYESRIVRQLPARENQLLLVRREALFVLNALLHNVDGIGGLYVEGDGLASEGFNGNLHVAFGEYSTASTVASCTTCDAGSITNTGASTGAITCIGRRNN
jgi:hypothetical protein